MGKHDDTFYALLADLKADKQRVINALQALGESNDVRAIPILIDLFSEIAERWNYRHEPGIEMTAHVINALVK